MSLYNLKVFVKLIVFLAYVFDYRLDDELFEKRKDFDIIAEKIK